MPRPSRRIVVTHPKFGIFLGFDHHGNGWWSSYNPLGISVATTFETEISAETLFVSRLSQVPWSEVTLTYVDTEGEMPATVLQMTRAGITDPALYGDMIAHLDPIGQA